MSKVWFLFILMLLGFVFLIVKRTEPMHFFLYSEQKLTLQNYVYYGYEHLILIGLANVVRIEIREHKQFALLFLLIQIGDFIDYLLCYNDPWFKFYGFNVTYNVASCLVFGFAISAYYIRRWIE